MDIGHCLSYKVTTLTVLPVTECKAPCSALITVDEIAGVRLHSYKAAQRRKLNYNIPTKIIILTFTFSNNKNFPIFLFCWIFPYSLSPSTDILY